MSCAVGKTNCDKGECTCFSEDDVFNFVIQYNKYIQQKTINCKHCIKIKGKNKKKYLFYYLSELKKKICENCDEIEFLRNISSKFINKVTAKKIFKNSFRPIGPINYDWLSNYEINDVMTQYTNYYTNFLYIDTVPIDFCQDSFFNLYKKNLNRKYGIRFIGTIYNTDPSYKPGQHWIASFVDMKKKEIYFYDSVGRKAPHNIRILFEKVNLELFDNNTKLYYNDFKHQYKNSECGVYCLHFITKMIEGVSFQSFCKMKNLDDESVNKLRSTFFNKDGI